MIRSFAITNLLILLALAAAPLAAQTDPAAVPETEPAKLSIPSPDAQSRARQLIQKVFQDELTKTSSADRRKLAKTLLQQGIAPEQDSPNRFVLLNQSAETAANAADITTALAAVGQLALRYDLAPADIHSRQLTAIQRSTMAADRPADYEAIAKAACTLMQLTLLNDDFPSGRKYSAIADSAAARSKNVALAASIGPKLEEYRTLSADFERAEAARSFLATAPDDADANLTLGRYLALVKNRWTEALPHLAVCPDAKLAAAAKIELQNPAEPIALVYLGDSWWEISMTYTGLQRAALRAHAQVWYAAAKAAGLTVARTEARLADPSANTPLVAAPAFSTMSAYNYLDLLPLVDVAADTVAGSFKSGPHSLTVAKSLHARLALPYEPADDYDFIVEFTRVEGGGSITLLIHAHNASFGYSIGVKSSAECRFESVAHHVDEGNPTITKWPLDSARRHIAIIQVRKDSVTALLDGKKITTYPTDYKDLTRYALWKLSNEKQLGIGANNATVIFHSIEIREVTGTGKKLRDLPQ